MSVLREVLRPQVFSPDQAIIASDSVIVPSEHTKYAIGGAFGALFGVLLFLFFAEIPGIEGRLVDMHVTTDHGECKGTLDLRSSLSERERKYLLRQGSVVMLNDGFFFTGTSRMSRFKAELIDVRDSKVFIRLDSCPVTGTLSWTTVLVLGGRNDSVRELVYKRVTE